MILNLTILLILNVIIEFLPISSTAHSIVINKLLNIDFNLNIILALSQIGITLAVCYYFKNIIKDIIVNLFRLNREYFLFCFKILITMLPSVFIGCFFYGIIKTYCQSSMSIGIGLICGSLLMYFAEKYYLKNHNGDTNNIKQRNDLFNISFKDVCKIGLFQSLSLMSGVSRSATTISAGMLSNFSRIKAVEMAFFISIPVSFGGACFDLYKCFDLINNDSYLMCLYILLLSFILSLLFMKKIINFLQNNSLHIFIFYRIIFGLLLIFI
ncbi:MAG: undecaprenyl-diphosphate phosphatase [Rickettsiales bacterium]|nr:undecaprenyl-diphosphate phosphatase [Rickettsiales bacterium]